MKHLCYTSLVLLAGLAMACDTQAFGGSRGSYGSYGGSYGGSHAVSYGGSHGGGSYGGSHGSRGGGLLSRIGSRIRSRGSHGSHGGGSYGGGSYGSYGGSYATSYRSSYSSNGSYGSYGGSSYGSSANYSSYSSTESPSGRGPSGNSATTQEGVLSVTVPADAKVYVNGTLTTSTGTERQYVSHGLESGRSYSYEVRVETTRSGKVITETKQVTLTAGSNELLAFTSAPAVESVATKLQIRVPATARVTLSGVATKQSGEVREYVTTRLADGQTWTNYKVVVEFDADGETLTKEKTITLRGGETQQLAFDFPTGVKLALRE